MAVKKILVAHDFSDGANRALRFGADLARQCAAELEVVYVYPDIYEGDAPSSLTLPNTLTGQGERYLDFLEEELRRIVVTVAGPAFSVAKCHVLRGDTVKLIEQLSQERRVDIVCVGATGKGLVQRVLLGSVSQMLLRNSKVGVLVVP